MMKKKFFAVAMATTMALSTAMSASAATVEGAWWTQWTEGYELADGATLEFDVTVKGGDAVWNNVAAVFAARGKGDRPIRRNRRGKAPEPDKYFV